MMACTIPYELLLSIHELWKDGLDNSAGIILRDAELETGYQYYTVGRFIPFI